jgi:hypothetical protein
MSAILGLTFLYVVVQTLLLAVAVAIGFLLKWLIPDLSIGIGILVGMLSTVASAYLFVQLLRLSHQMPQGEWNLDDQDEEEEDDVAPELHVTLPSLGRGRRRRRKR